MEPKSLEVDNVRFDIWFIWTVMTHVLAAHLNASAPLVRSLYLQQWVSPVTLT